MITLVSGGARGVDEAAAGAALAAGGKVIVVLPDSLLKAGSSAKYRSFLMEGQLTLVSPNQPEAVFSVGSAMGRNKYVYCLADVAVVVASDRERGGTWTGAVENLKYNWVPLWVPPEESVDSGLPLLVNRGARLLDEGPNPSLPGVEVAKPISVVREPLPGERRPTLAEVRPPQLYDVFLQHLRLITASAPADAKFVAQQLDLAELQVRTWLRRARKEQLISSSGRPVRYRWTGGDGVQPNLFPPEE
jgi:predicted Rossmann fold nucleotide-binding protein DprA/Smf involved in DNA uptake